MCSKRALWTPGSRNLHLTQNCGAPGRSTQLDSVVLIDRRAFLAGILSDGDVETLRHLLKEVLATIRKRALA